MPSNGLDGFATKVKFPVAVGVVPLGLLPPPEHERREAHMSNAIAIPDGLNTFLMMSFLPINQASIRSALRLSYKPVRLVGDVALSTSQ